MRKRVELIKKFEGLNLSSYKCPAGKTTVGYGHVIGIDLNCTITEEEADRLLLKDLVLIEEYLNSSVVITSLSQGQFDALTSLIYNWGIANFGKSKGFKYLNQGKKHLASIEFFSKEKGVVNINGKFSKGLYNRRQDELKLYNEN